MYDNLYVSDPACVYMFLGSFTPPICFALFWLAWLIINIIIIINTCLFSNERERKSVKLGGWGSGEGLEKVEGGEIII